MIAVDLFANAMGMDARDQARAQRVVSAAKVLRTVRHAKVVPGPGIYLDAAMAVLDAVRAYANYRQAEEVTHQLMIEGERLNRLIQELYRQQDIDRQQQAHEAAAQHARTQRRLAQRVADIQLTQQQLVAFGRQAKKLGQAIARQRENAPPCCPQLAALEDTYYRFMDQHLRLATCRLESRPEAEPTPSEEGSS